MVSKWESDNFTREWRLRDLMGISRGTAIDSVWGITIAVMRPFWPSVVRILILILRWS